MGNRFYLLLGVGFLLTLVFGVGAGVFVVQRQQSQDIRSKAAPAVCDMRFPADPATACGRSTQSPAQDAQNVSLTPHFHWDYGGDRPGETGCTSPSGCGQYAVAVSLAKTSNLRGNPGEPLVGFCKIEGAASPIKDADLNCFKNASGNVLTALEPETDYWWLVIASYGCGTVNCPHTGYSWNYHFKTGAVAPPPALVCDSDCSSRPNDCPSPLACLSGRCRNPSCPSRTDCNCPSALVCSSVAMLPDNPAISASASARQLTAYASGGTTPYTYSWAVTTDGASPGVLSAATGQTVTWTAPDLSSVNNVQNWEVKAAVADAAGQTASGSACSKTLTYTPEISAACQMVTADKDLSNLRIGDTIKFTGYGSLTADPAADAIDKIGFRVYKNNNLVLEQIMDTVRAPEKDTGRQKFWKAEYSYYLSGAGSYSVKIRVHWKSRDIWMM